MRTIERRFNKIKKENEHWSDYVCLGEAVYGQKFTRRSIYEYFIKLVDPEEYDTLDTNLLVRHLYLISKQAEECTFLTKNAPESTKTDRNEYDIITPTIPVYFSRKRANFVID